MKKKLAYNTLTSLIYNLVTIACGLILPRVVLGRFGSEVNGLVDSITQFLSAITFLELGIGAVVRSALYKPLAEKNDDEVSKVLVSANKFFRRIARVLFVYVIILAFVYPLISNNNYGYGYVATMVVILSIGSFAQYYFGIVNSLLLAADQRGYIQYSTQIIAVMLNAVATILLINYGCGIHVVKMTTAMIYLIQPLVMHLYVRTHYSINKRIEYSGEPIKQKWNGIAQHIATIILTGTDNIVLTIFSTLSDVSIYSVYNKVVYGITQLMNALTSGIQSIFGELWAKNEKEKLFQYYALIEWMLHTVVTFIFGVTAILIVPFINVYTDGIIDANYNQPIFGVMLVMANAFSCYRIPYNLMILAAGHYKQTQNGFIISAGINVIVSIVAVKLCGLIGVVFGTLIAVLYQTMYMANYTARNLVNWPMKKTIKQFAIDMLTIILMYGITWNIQLGQLSYISWILLAIQCSLISIIIVALVNLLFYKDRVFNIFRK